MEKTKKKLLPKSNLIKTLLIFFSSFLFFILIWLFVNDYYEMAITCIASRLIPVFKNVSISYIEMKKDFIAVVFVPKLKKAFPIVFQIKYYYYTFSVPLTLAIMTTFYPYLKRKRIYLEVLLILITFHILFVFFLEWYIVTYEMMIRGLEKFSMIKLDLGFYFQTFMVIMIVRILPFLIGVYLFFRVKSSKVAVNQDNTS